MLRQRYPLNVDLARAFTEFLDSENILYKVHSHNLADELEEVLQHENFIVDRSDESDAKVSAKLVRLMQFGITSEKSGEQAPADIMESVPMPVHRSSRPSKKTGSDSDSDDSSASTTRKAATPSQAGSETRTRRMMTTRRVCRPMTRLRRTFAQQCCFNRTWLRQRSRCPWRLGNVHSTLMIGHRNTVRVVLPMSLPSTRAPYQRSVGWAA